MNIILTIPGEKPFNREFGTRLEDSLFDNFNYTDSINTQIEIRKTLERFEPRIEVEHVVLGDVPHDETTSIVPGHSLSASKAAVSDANQLFVYISYFLVKGSGSVGRVQDEIVIGVTKVR